MSLRSFLAALLVTGASALAVPASSSAGTAWLCGPQVPAGVEDPCRPSLDTTIEEPGGTSRVVRATPPEDPGVDCFYVYPTASEQLGTNADAVREPSVVSIARYQAARFSQECRVVAPLYRQLTLASIAVGSPSARAVGARLAYEDVRAAWREYLSEIGDGRGVVLVGHSQGTGMLRRLISDEIDPDPAARARLVSALLLGGNVVVKAGERTGGDFENVPLCASHGETGCVIAFSVFDETPPQPARFGRPPAEPANGLGGGPGTEVACTNPASLARNERSTFTPLLRGEPFEGPVLAAGLLVTFGGPPPTARTSWVQPRERYSGRCERVDGAHVLMVAPEPGARDLEVFPDAGWGLHITDVNIALGDLVEEVAAQKATYLAPPRLRLRFDAAFGRDARGRRCSRSGVRATVAGADRDLVERMELRLRGRRVAADRRAPFSAALARSPRRLRAGRLERVEARVTTLRGRTTTIARRVRMCA